MTPRVPTEKSVLRLLAYIQQLRLAAAHFGRPQHKIRLTALDCVQRNALAAMRLVIDAEFFDDLQNAWIGPRFGGLIVKRVERLAVFVLVDEDIELELHSGTT
jgi:hypothetical protein